MDEYKDVEHGYVFDVQSDLPWTQTNRMTLRAPAIANRIFDTLAHAQAYIDDISPKASAVPGIMLSVFNDNVDSKNNGVYRVTKVKTSAQDTAGILERVGGNITVEVTNITTSLEEYNTDGIYFITDTTTGKKYLLLISVIDGVPVQTLWGIDGYKERVFFDESGEETWSDWVSHSYEFQENKKQAIDDNPNYYPSNAAVKAALDAIYGELSKKANTDGVYPNLTAGNILAQESDTALATATGFIFRTAGGDESIGTGSAKFQKIVGPRLDLNGCTPFMAKYLKAVHYNAFDKEHCVISGATINNNGTINRSAGAGKYIAFVKVVEGELNGNNGYVVAFGKDATGTLGKIGYTTTNPAEATSVTVLSPTTIKGQDCYLAPSVAYLMISTDNIDNLYVHLKWSYEASRDAGYIDYSESVIPLPRAHSWGTVSIRDKQEVIDFASLLVYRMFNRALLASLGAWTEAISYGEYAYSDSARTQSVGTIEAYSDSSITVGETAYSRYSSGDADGSLAWKDAEDNVVFTTRVVTYTSADALSDVAASTTYVATPAITGVTFSIDATGHVVGNTGSTVIGTSKMASRVSGKYIYYELATPTITSLTTSDYYELESETGGKVLLEYDVHDFGTEEFLFGEDTPVPALELSILYLINMKDGLRALLMRNAYATYTVDFGRYGLEAHTKNMIGDTTMQVISPENVATLKLTVGTMDYIINLSTVTHNISIPYKAALVWQITKTDPNLPAFIGVRELVVTEA